MIKFLSGTSNPRELCVACARIAYRSSHLASPAEDARLLSSLIKRGHRAITEFARIVFEIDVGPEILIEFMARTHGWVLTDNILSLNPRTLWDGRSLTLGKMLIDETPQEYLDLVYGPTCKELGGVYYDTTSKVSIWNEFEFINNEHSFRVVRIRASRGLMDELFRHRLGAMVGTSTRRVPMNDLYIELPDTPESNQYIQAMFNVYNMLKQKDGLDEARKVFPLGAHCNFVYGTSYAHWDYIKSLRTSKAAHKEFKEIFK